VILQPAQSPLLDQPPDQEFTLYINFYSTLLLKKTKPQENMMDNPRDGAKEMTFANIKLRLTLLLILLVLVLSACSQKSNQGTVSNEALSAPLPEALLKATVVFDATNLLVELQVDGGEPQACTDLGVDQANGTFSCSTTLPVGAHALVLIYSVIDPTFGTVQVTTTSAINVNIVAGQSTPADFSSATLNNLDSDGDGISNLDELDVGSDPGASSYSVGGTVSGLLGSGAVIQLNGGNDLALSGDGGFNFIRAVADNRPYTVTVLTQPSSPSQTCSVAKGSGVVNDAGADVTDVTVTCAAAAYTVGGTVAGLDGSGLVLQNNAADDLPINIDGDFTFATAVADGSPYAVTVLSQPSSPSQTCRVTNGSGTVSGANVTDVTVTCVTVIVSYTVGGTVIGLAGSGLVLQNNAGDNLPISLDGNFTFTTAVADGGPYAVTVLTQPVTPNQICNVTSGAGSGTISGVNVVDVRVMCSCVLGTSLIGSCTLE